MDDGDVISAVCYLAQSLVNAQLWSSPLPQTVLHVHINPRSKQFEDAYITLFLKKNLEVFCFTIRKQHLHYLHCDLLL